MDARFHRKTDGIRSLLVCQRVNIAVMARMTRAESQANTRAQLLATARQMFFTDGYHPTSLEKVADAAGYSKGAVYSNFRNKDELCVAVLDEVRAERLAEPMGLVSPP